MFRRASSAMLMGRAMIVALLSGLLVAAQPPVSAAPIEVAVSNIRSARGVVHVDICTEQTFLDDCPWSGEAPAQVGTTIVTVRGVPPGRYAAQGFHDKNANGKVDRMFLGIPTEGVGFSNDAPIHMAPPKFAHAAFDHGEGAQRITFKLRYF